MQIALRKTIIFVVCDCPEIIEMLYTIVTNAEAKTQKGALIAMIKGTKSKDVEKILNKIPIEIRLKVKTVTKDFAKWVFWMAK